MKTARQKIRIDQVLAGFADGDAISGAALAVRAALRRAGYESDIFSPDETTSPTLRSERFSLERYEPRSCDICIHHYGIWSKAARLFLDCGARKALLYHNITPAEYFLGFNDELAGLLREGRARLGELINRSDAIWACSKFNASELAALGAVEIGIFPPPFSPLPACGAGDASQAVARRLAGPLENILFVGRVAPNKRIEDLITTFAWYNKTMNQFSRLVIAGSVHSAPEYYAMLRLLVLELDLPNVCFMEFLAGQQLAACYDAADVYVCTSEHEGYCLPLVEAMSKGVPVIARDAGGKAEALGGAGVLYRDMAPEETASLIRLVLTDESLRAEILSSQQRRMQSVLARDIGLELENLLRPLLA